MNKMDDDTLLEVIKALAFGEDIDTIANMAEVEPEDIEEIARKYTKDIEERKRIGGEI